MTQPPDTAQRLYSARVEGLGPTTWDLARDMASHARFLHAVAFDQGGRWPYRIGL